MHRQEPVGLLVVTVRRKIKQVTSILLREEDLSPQQFWTMIVIARYDGLSLRALAARRQMDEPTACRVVNSLVKRRLVRRSPDAADRRRSRLVLTNSGAEMAARLLPLAQKVTDLVEGALTAAERHAVIAGLRKVVEGLDRFQEEVSGRGPDTAVAAS